MRLCSSIQRNSPRKGIIRQPVAALQHIGAWFIGAVGMRDDRFNRRGETQGPEELFEDVAPFQLDCAEGRPYSGIERMHHPIDDKRPEEGRPQATRLSSNIPIENDLCAHIARLQSRRSAATSRCRSSLTKSKTSRQGFFMNPALVFEPIGKQNIHHRIDCNHKDIRLTVGIVGHQIVRGRAEPGPSAVRRDRHSVTTRRRERSAR